MNGPATPGRLEQECRVFSRYLAGIEATPYILEAYVRGHAQLPANRSLPDSLDQFLLSFAQRSPLLTRLADAYARRARPTGILRQKLVLQLAVLESSPPAHGWINGAETGPIGLVVAKAGWAVCLAIVSLALAATIFGPIHAVTAIHPGARGG